MALKYKVGDRVRIKSLDWYNENKDEDGIVELSTRVFIPEMLEHCGTIVTIKDVFEDVEGNAVYYMKEIDWDWTDEMIEGLVEEEFEVDLIPKFGEYSDNEPLDVPTMTTEFVKEHGLPCPEGYIFKDENGNVINATKIVLEKKKKEYPKTFEECVHVLEGENRMSLEQMNTFRKLIDARNAYWKLAGEEMGLGKPWEPDWKNSEERRYSIVNIEGDINLPEKTLTKWILKVTNKILVFPTEEMRDAFKKNFDPDIEICKELL